jgi:hypothetical protein
MPVLHTFVVRGNSSTALTPTMVNLLIALVVLFASVALLVGILLILRQMRRTRKAEEQRELSERLPMYTEKPASSARSSRLTITTSSYAVHEKETLIDSAGSPTRGDVPEIRITFPEEVDETGKRTSGRVVVVKVGDHSVGLEPVHEDLPAYQQTENGRFQSLDLDRMGGLKEKDMR